MVLLVHLSLITIAFLYGTALLRLLRSPRRGIDDQAIVGFFILIGLAQAAHLMGVLLGQSFLACLKCFLLLNGFVTLMSVIFIVCTKTRLIDRSYMRSMLAKKELYVFLILMALICFFMLLNPRLELYRNQTIETIQSFLTTNQIYGENVLTGEGFQVGMPTRIKILCTPTFYGFICQMLSIEPYYFVATILPILLLVLYVFLAMSWARELQVNPWIFLITIVLLYALGNIELELGGICIAYGLLCARRKQYLLVILCILAEACTCWTLYGLGGTVLAVAIYWLVSLLLKKCFPEEQKAGET